MDGFAFPKIENLKWRPVISQRSHHSLDGVVDVSVIAPSRAVAELVYRFATKNAAGEFVNRQIRPLPRSVNCEKPKDNDAHLVEMGKGRTKKFPGNLRGSVGTDRLGKMKVFGKRHRFADAVNGRTRCKNKALDPDDARGLEQMQRAVYICIVI